MFEPGQEVLLKAKFLRYQCSQAVFEIGKDPNIFVGVGPNGWREALDAAVVTAPATPAPLSRPDGWKPKKGERVLVECVSNGDNCITHTLAGLEFPFYTDPDKIYPYPAQPRFAVGDEVFVKSKMVIGSIEYQQGVDMWRVDYGENYGDFPEADLMPLEEARRPLGVK